MLLMNLTPEELEEPMIVASIKIITSHLEVDIRPSSSPNKRSDNKRSPSPTCGRAPTLRRRQAYD